MSQTPDIDQLKTALIKGDRVALAKAITLVESAKAEHQEKAAELLALCAPHAVESKRIGITGVPGVGKSSFIEVFGSFLTSKGHKVAVLAVDPSSDISKGSILGDKTRMERLAADPNAFIRPTPAAGSMGGGAKRTRETIVLCEAAGFDIVLIETVGVGQSEVTVHSMVDMFLVMTLANAGDELQGIKRGIMELADLVLINKDDGPNATYTKLAKASYQQALHLFPPKESGWTVPILSCSSIEERGIAEVWKAIQGFFAHIEAQGFKAHNRVEQNRSWLRQAIEDGLLQRFFTDKGVAKRIKASEEAVMKGQISPFKAANDLLKGWGQNN